MTANKNFSQFLLLLASTLVLGIILSVLLVFIIDPYGIYRQVDITGFNHIKPGLKRNQEQIKLTIASKVKSNAYILGNSRAEIGFNPEHIAFRNTGYSAYNLAIPGTFIDTASRQNRYLRSIGQQPELAIIGLDFLDFLHFLTRKKSAFSH